MSIKYDIELQSENDITLKLNIGGVKNGTILERDFSLLFYAYKISTATPLFNTKLNINETRNLYAYLNNISIVKDVLPNQTLQFIEADASILAIIGELQKVNPTILASILEKFNEEEKITALLTTLSEVELEHLLIAHKHKRYKGEIINLKQLLELEESNLLMQNINTYPNLLKYIAGQPEKIFQNWIEANLWVFGVDYKSHKNDARKIALFSEADLIMESLDGFMDLIELKRPQLNIMQHDTSHTSYYPTKELSKALGQSGLYLKKMDEYKMQLQNEHKIKVLRPRVKIIIGRTHNFSEEEFEAMRMLNSNLNHIQIISYDYIVACGEKIIEHYETA